MSYDLGVLLANYIIDRGLRGDAAIRAFASESVELIDGMERAWHEGSRRLGLSWRKQEREGTTSEHQFITSPQTYEHLPVDPNPLTRSRVP